MSNEPVKKKVTVSDAMDRAFVGIQMPTKKILKQAVGMVITGMSREKQVSNDRNDGSFEVLDIELDAFATMRISVHAGEVLIETLPTGRPRMTLEEKVRFVVEHSPEDTCASG